MGFLEQLFKGFFRSAVNQVGKDGGRIISNKIYNGNNSIPFRKLSEEEINKKEILITDICELLKVEKEDFLNGISSGQFNLNINLSFTDNKINGKDDFKTKCTNLYCLLNETEKFNLNHFHTQMSNVFEREEKKFNLKLKYETQLTEENLSLLLDGKYFIGMTEEMVKESFGEPTKIEVEALKSKTKHTYIYGNKNSGDVLVFENEKLVRFKDR